MNNELVREEIERANDKKKIQSVLVGKWTSTRDYSHSEAELIRNYSSRAKKKHVA